MKRKIKIIISGGGTGGHIFPALAIAEELKNRFNDIDILFVGANDRMEMVKIPEAGFKIIGLPIYGLQRKFSLRNIILPLYIIISLIKSIFILLKFKPNVVVGVGGYASVPVVFIAQILKIPTVIQEQNSLPGLANRFIGKRATAICVAYEGLEKYFPEDKIKLTGNPIRKKIINLANLKIEAYNKFNIDTSHRVILILGGSLGAKTINNSVFNYIEYIENQNNLKIIWQTGKIYYDEIIEKLKNINTKNILVLPFINEIEYAYAIADVIISRAGAIALSELCVVGKPVILVPSPNVTDDHQTKNAVYLANKNAAIVVNDNEAITKLIPEAIQLLNDENKKNTLSKNILKLAKPNATELIIEEITKLL